MRAALYMDAHVPMPITRQLRLPGVDVVTATEAGTNRLPDDKSLQLASAQGRRFTGLPHAHAGGAPTGPHARDWESLAQAASPEELANRVMHLSL